MTQTRPATQETFPREATLRDGTAVTLRLMEAADRDAVVAFARSLPPDELLFLRTDITDPHVVDEWVRNIEQGRTITVLGEAGGQLAGYGSLHYNDVQWMRHVGEIRILVSHDYRGRGLGRRLTNEVFALARGLGLQKIMARMTPDQVGARATFERLGFKPEALLADFVIDREGKTRDLLMMSLDLSGFTNTE
ncbi:MAG: GNAT family N-acetyltransferase [Chloroflexi bacterium]|nr:GNAT family N-acetyltransferase [Chloroflexota bacterium]